jgi:hypothetical protein
MKNATQIMNLANNLLALHCLPDGQSLFYNEHQTLQSYDDDSETLFARFRSTQIHKLNDDPNPIPQLEKAFFDDLLLNLLAFKYPHSDEPAFRVIYNLGPLTILTYNGQMLNGDIITILETDYGFNLTWQTAN